MGRPDVQHPVHGVFVESDMSCLLAVPGGAGRKENPAHDRPGRHGCLLHFHDDFFVTKGECSRSGGRDGVGEASLFSVAGLGY